MPQIIREFRDILRKNSRLVTVTMVTSLVIALLAAVFKPNSWCATQGLIVRDEAVGDFRRLGRFESTDAMQTAQETILEIARYKSVVREALADVGPPEGQRADVWPSDKDIEACQGNISIEAPQGAQFGRTELIYLVVKDSSPQRAVALNEAVCDQMDERLKFVRNNKYQSVIHELEKSELLAAEELKRASEEVARIEKSVGSDLAELRSMIATSGDGVLTRTLNEITNEIRQARSQLDARKNLLAALHAAQKNPADILATPNQLLELQPSLRRLKDGLVDAQLRTAQLAGARSKDHPEVQAAIQAEAQVRQELFAEIAVAIRGLDSDIHISQLKLERLNSQKKDVEARLDRLVAIRTNYANLTTAARAKSDVLERVRGELSTARANERAAKEVSLIARVDHAVADSRPSGPSRRTIVLAGLFLGLCITAGLLFLTEPRLGGSRYPWQNLFSARKDTTAESTAVARVGGRRASDPKSDRRNPEQPGRRDTDISLRNVAPPIDLAPGLPDNNTPAGA
jgi:uncharacterized protein involved in exopolysaccharide biosynthesis